MKLASVTFHKPRKFGRMELAGIIVTEENVDDLRLDEQSQCVVVDDAYVPLSEVQQMERLNLELVCERCGKDFANQQGLKGHMRHCKDERQRKGEAEMNDPDR